VFAPQLQDLPVEEFHVDVLDSQRRLERTIRVATGTLRWVAIHPRELFRQVIGAPAASIVLVHNHPSGDPTPSTEDRQLTEQGAAAGDIVGAPVDDHVIIGATAISASRKWLALSLDRTAIYPTCRCGRCRIHLSFYLLPLTSKQSMALSIKNPEADRLARELAAITGESLSEAVVEALRERLARTAGRRRASSLRNDIKRIQDRIARLPVLDRRTDEEIVGYDEHGLPN
jgi:antitoxin VapB